MGRPIKKIWFGPVSTPGAQIIVNGVKWADGTTATNAYIVKQTGDRAYIVSNGSKTEPVFMVNATSVGGLLPGQCFITAKPFGGSARPCEKIAQYRLSLYEADGTINDYSWSTIPAVKKGEADLITGGGAVGSILSVAVNNAGFGYSTAPSVTFTGGGSGAVATATVANGVVTGINVSSGGYNYANGGVTLSAPPAAVTATATATVDGGGTVSALAITNAGRYYTVAPAVTITGDGTNATATATIANGVVTGFVITNPGSGYTSATVSIAAPSPSVTATATATIST